MINVFDTGLFIAAIIYRLVLFSMFNNIDFFTKRNILFNAVLIMITCLIKLIRVDFSTALSMTFMIAAVVCFYGRKEGYSNSLCTILLADLVTYFLDLLWGVVGQFIPNLVLYYVPLTLLYFVIFYFLLKKLDIKSLINSESSKAFLGIIVYSEISLHLIGLLYLNPVNGKVNVLFVGILLFGQLLFMLYLLMFQNKIQQAKLLKEKQVDLNNYIKNLEYNEEKLRRFEHDYKNMLNSLKLSASKEDSKKLLAQLDMYSQNEFKTNSLWKFHDLVKVKNPVLKSILISKINKADSLHIPCTFECVRVIENISSVNVFDLSRIIGIVFDNAIEASKNDTSPQLKVFLYKNQKEISFEIANHISEKIDLNKIAKKGYTSKYDHKGYGLSNVENISKKYPNMFIRYEVKENYFIFKVELKNIED